MTGSKQEAAIGAVAALVRVYYTALVAEGFTPDQAIDLTARMQAGLLMLNRERGGAA